jgi:hypothetical protein
MSPPRTTNVMPRAAYATAEMSSSWVMSNTAMSARHSSAAAMPARRPSASAISAIGTENRRPIVSSALSTSMRTAKIARRR